MAKQTFENLMPETWFCWTDDPTNTPQLKVNPCHYYSMNENHLTYIPKSERDVVIKTVKISRYSKNMLIKDLIESLAAVQNSKPW